MSSFSAGFISEAIESGLPHSEAVRMLKRASEYPGMRPFTEQDSYNAENIESGPSMEALKELIDQDAINKNFGGFKRKITVQ